MRNVKLPEYYRGVALINNEAVECEIIKAIVYFDVESTEILRKKLFVKYADGTSEVDEYNYFKDLDNLKAGNAVDWNNIWYFRADANFSEDGNHVDYWVFENGKAVNKSTYLACVEARYEYSSGFKSITLDFPDLPTDIYKTAEECYSFNDIVVLHEDGTRETIVGASNLVSLTDKQKVVVEEIQKLMKKAKEMGVKFYINDETDFIFNANNISEYEFSYDKVDGCDYVNVRNKRFRWDLPIYTACCDEDLYVSRKK